MNSNPSWLPSQGGQPFKLILSHSCHKNCFRPVALRLSSLANNRIPKQFFNFPVKQLN
jgi:hypothetical protein